MKILLTIAMIFSVNVASAFMPNIPSAKDFPSDSNWAVAMTERACKVRFQGDVEGSIDKAKSGVIYTVTNANGVVLAQAWARSTFIGAKKRCMMK